MDSRKYLVCVRESVATCPRGHLDRNRQFLTLAYSAADAGYQVATWRTGGSVVATVVYVKPYEAEVPTMYDIDKSPGCVLEITNAY